MFDDKEKGLAPGERGLDEANEGILVAEYKQPVETKSDRGHWEECFEVRGDLVKYTQRLRQKALKAWWFRERVEGNWPGFYMGAPEKLFEAPKKPITADLHYVRDLDRTRVVALLDACNPEGPLDPEYLDNQLIEFCRREYDNGRNEFYLREGEQEPLIVSDIASAMKVIERPGRLPKETIGLPPEEKLKLPRQPDTGARMNLREVLTNSWNISPKWPLFGPHVEKRHDLFDINSFFSELLAWDDDHCFRLQASIHNAQVAKGNDVKDEESYGQIWIAAEQWINKRRTNHIYCRYPPFDSTDNLSHKKYECR